MRDKLITKITIICTIVVISITLTSCLGEEVFNLLDKTAQSVFSYEYTVSFEFSNISDKEIIEERLNILGFEILNKNSDDNLCTYILERYYQAEEGIFDVLSTNDLVSITDKNMKEILTRKEVVNIKYKMGTIYLNATDSFFEEFQNKYLGNSIYFVCGNKKIDVDAFYDSEHDEKNTTIKISIYDDSWETINENDEILIKGALALSTKPLVGTVSSKIVDK